MDYQKKADELFNKYENKYFWRERTDVSRSFELVCSFSDWIDSFDRGDLAEVAGLYEEYKDPDDAEREEEKLKAFIKAGIDNWLGNAFEDTIKTLGKWRV